MMSNKPKQPDEELVHLLAEIREVQELSREGFDALTKYCISGPAFENAVHAAYTLLSEAGFLAILKEARSNQDGTTLWMTLVRII